MLQGIRVLILEALQDEADLAIGRLTDAGIRCVPLRVASEHEFRAALTRFRPHLILSHLRLPGFDGLAALEMALQLAPNAPFIFLSVTAGEGRAVQALCRGAADYVLKSNPDRLQSAVRRAVREGGARGRGRSAERQMRAREQRLRDIIDTVQDWIW